MPKTYKYYMGCDSTIHLPEQYKGWGQCATGIERIYTKEQLVEELELSSSNLMSIEDASIYSGFIFSACMLSWLFRIAFKQYNL